MFYTIGGFTLDDTVLPSGEVQWSAPGGNVLYSAIGAKIWANEVGIIGVVGHDYPETYLDQLKKAGFDLDGVRRIDYTSFHVWILHEGEGRRQIIYRLDSGKNQALDPTDEDLPSSIVKAKGVHICPILGASQAILMEHLLSNKVPTFLDLIVIPDQIDVHSGHNRNYWPKLHGFLPSIEEVRALFGNLPLGDLIHNMQEVGPELFAIKMGALGCVVRNPIDGEIYHVPAYPTNVIDATGAGDSFCGGFMVGAQGTGDPIMAALYGTVSASFVIEDFGALHALHIKKGLAYERLESLRPKVRRLVDSPLTNSF
jgi:ribokinase